MSERPDIEELKHNLDLLSGQTFGFVRGASGPWMFSGDADTVTALSSLPDDATDLLAYVLDLEEDLAAARNVADAAVAFRSADKDRMAHLNGCVMPDPAPRYVAARDEFRRTADDWAARQPGPAGET